jgi:hypothetical protein
MTNSPTTLTESPTNEEDFIIEHMKDSNIKENVNKNKKAKTLLEKSK